MTSRIIAFDVETPNLRNNRICSIGISIIENGCVTDTKTFLVNPECEFDRKNIEIHGIYPEDVINVPTFDVLWKEIAPLFRGNLIVAHNATFDLCVLKKTLSAYGIIEGPLYFVCTMKIARDVLYFLENYKLPTLCNYYGIALNHHDAGSDSSACAEILCKLLESGLDLNEFIAAYSLAEACCSQHSTHRKESTTTQALHELTAVLSAISVDGIITPAEVEFLSEWLEYNSDLRGNYPYDKIYHTLSDILADGAITQVEIDMMLDLFQKVSDPIKDTSCSCCGLSIEGKTVCLSGNFDRGDKNDIGNRLVALGATVVGSVTRKTDILLVGGKGSTAWSSGNYGSKIKKALEMQEKGIEIVIIREDDFFAMMEN